MRVVKLGADNRKEFVEYSKRYSKEQDESYTANDRYTLNDKEFGFLIINDEDQITGAAVLMISDPYYNMKLNKK